MPWSLPCIWRVDRRLEAMYQDKRERRGIETFSITEYFAVTKLEDRTHPME